MQVGTTSTGETINFDDSPFDTAYIKIPNLGIVWDMTKDMGNGNALTMQATGTANMTNTPDWQGNSHFNHNNSHAGQGNVIVIRDSNTDKLMHELYNAINPMGNDNKAKGKIVAQNAPFTYFTVEYENSSTEDNGGNPSEYAIAEGCYFNNTTPLAVSEGSNNSQNSDTWSYQATTIYSTEGEPQSELGQPTNGLDKLVHGSVPKP